MCNIRLTRNIRCPIYVSDNQLLPHREFTQNFFNIIHASFVWNNQKDSISSFLWEDWIYYLSDCTEPVILFSLTKNSFVICKGLKYFSYTQCMQHVHSGCMDSLSTRPRKATLLGEIDPEEEGTKILRNVRNCLPVDTA